MAAVVKFDVSLSSDSESWIPIGTAFMVNAGYAKEEENDIPVWIFLTSNHAILEEMKGVMQNGGEVGFRFWGVDTWYGKSNSFEVPGKLIGCRGIIADGENVATLLAVKGNPGMLVDHNPNTMPPDYYYPFPLERIGGPCSLGSEGMDMVGFPMNANGQSEPLLSHIQGPYDGVNFQEVHSGIRMSGIIGRGLGNGGSSGSSLLDRHTGNICAVLNFGTLEDNGEAGFNVLPDQQFLQEQIEQFLQQQVKNLKSEN